jgi:hypothetical protein
MASETVGKENQAPLIIAVVLAALPCLVVIVGIMPILTLGFLIGALWYGALRSPGEMPYARCVWIVAFTVFTYIYFVGLPPLTDGVFLSKLHPAINAAIGVFVDGYNKILPKRYKFGSVSVFQFRAYLWLSLLAAAGFAILFRFRPMNWQISFYKIGALAFFPFKFASNSWRQFFISLIVVVIAGAALGCPSWLADYLGLIFLGYQVFRFMSYQFRSFLEDWREERLATQAGPIPIGVERERTWKRAVLTESQLNHHVHVVGASGFGKSVLLSHIIEHRIRSGSGLMFVDLKADIETIRNVVASAESVGRLEDLLIFSCGNPEISNCYNVVASGTANQIRDRIMSALTWSEEFYKNESASVLLKLLIGLVCLRDELNKPFGLDTVVAAISSPKLIEELAVLVPDNRAAVKNQLSDLATYLKNNDNFKALQGLRAQLESLVLSDFGHLLSASISGIDLFKAICEQKIVYVLLDSRRYGESSKSLGKLILEDLKSASAKIDNEISRPERKPFTVVIDEFADMATEDFIGFLDRARSSNIGVVVAHQEIADLDRISQEFKKRLMNSTSTTYAFLQKLPDSSELIAGISGTRKTEEVTEQAESKFPFFGDVRTGMKSIKIVDEFVIHPNVVRSLKVGECVLVEKYPEAKSKILIVNPESVIAHTKTEIEQTLSAMRKKSQRHSQRIQTVRVAESKLSVDPGVW